MRACAFVCVRVCVCACYFDMSSMLTLLALYATHCNTLQYTWTGTLLTLLALKVTLTASCVGSGLMGGQLRCVALCGSVLHCVAACKRVWQ